MTVLVFDHKQAIGDWVAEQVDQKASWGDFYAMGAADDTGILAGIVFNNFNDSNATCHIAVKKPGRYLKALLIHAYNYAFVHCNLKRLTAMIEADNAKSLRFTKHVGWEPEFIMRKGGSGGQDLYVMVLWPEKFIYRKALCSSNDLTS